MLYRNYRSIFEDFVSAYLISFIDILIDDYALFLRNGCWTKNIKPCFQPGPLSEIIAISNLGPAVSRLY